MVVKHCLIALSILALSACGRDQDQGSESQEANALPGSQQADANSQDFPTIANTVPSDWVRISANGFSFSVPSDMVERDVRGTDSYVRSYRNANFDLNFDYGMHTASAKNPDEMIDGKKAKITIENGVNEIDGIRYEVFSGVKFEDIGRPDVNLSMYIFGKTRADQETAKIIFRSIRFD